MNKSTNTLFIAATVCLCCLLESVCLAGPQPPSGWRYPGEADYKGDWKEFRKEIPEPFHVHADFNGDGLDDDAWILISTKDSSWGLFVFLSRQGKTPEVMKLMGSTLVEPDERLQGYGIKLVPPGKFVTACGKGHWECGPGEPKTLELTNPAINFFHYESFEWYYYWSKTTRTFKSISISD